MQRIGMGKPSLCRSDAFHSASLPVSCVLVSLLLGAALGQTVNDLQSPAIFRRLVLFANDALGVSVTQALYDGGVQSSLSEVDGDVAVTNLASSVSNRLTSRLRAVALLRNAASSAYLRNDISSTLTECCNLMSSDVTFDARFNTTVRASAGCDRISATATSPRPTLSSTITTVARQNLATTPELKFQYYGSEEGYATIYPGFGTSSCSNYDPRSRPWYVATAVPVSKDVVIVVDTSGSMVATVPNSGQRSRLDLAKEAMDAILDTLSATDRVSIVPFATTAGALAFGTNMSCFDMELGQVTPYSVRQLKYHIQLLSAGGGTSYSRAIQEAFRRLQRTSSRPQAKRIIIFLTDGLPGDSPLQILQAQQAGQAVFNHEVVVLTYALGTGIGSSGLDVLRRMALQQYSPSVTPVAAGEFQLISNFNNLRASLSRYYSFFATEDTTGATKITVPYYDAFGLGVILTVAAPVYSQISGSLRLRGVAGVDITISDLFGDISYFSDAEHQYAFMINNDGQALLHPLLSQPVDVASDPVFQDVTLLETDLEFRELVYKPMIRRTSGSASFIASRYVTVGNSRFEGSRSLQVNSSYYWRPIANTEFIVAVVLNNDIATEVNSLVAQSPPTLPTIYHRIDIELTRGSRCNQYGRLAVSDASSVKFSPEAFTSSSQYLNVPETLSTIRSYLSYLDGGGTNSHFKASVRDSVRLMAAVDDIWRSPAAAPYERSVVWRYIGSTDGVFRLIPGAQLTNTYDHLRRDWFTRALNKPGQLTLSSPYLDAFGAGYVVTLSHTISQSLQSSRLDAVGAVMGIDFTVGFLGQTLQQAYPQCANQYRCILFDTSGYLIYHPDFAASPANPEWTHLGHLEPYILRDLLQNRIFLKNRCSRFDAFQRYVTYDVNLTAPFSSSVQCATGRVDYKVEAVNNSNVVVGFLSSTACSGGNNLVCRCQALNDLGSCASVQTGTGCECPCSDILDYMPCNNSFASTTDNVCPAEIAGLPIVPSQQDAVSGLEPCFNGACNILVHSSDCRPTQGCSWCTHNMDRQLLSSPFCATDCVCFGGQQGQQNPAGSCVSVTNTLTSSSMSSGVVATTPVLSTSPGIAVLTNAQTSGSVSSGVIIGVVLGVITLLLVMLAIIYVYKQHSGKPAVSNATIYANTEHRPGVLHSAMEPADKRPVQAASGFDRQRMPSMTSSMDSAASPLYSPPPTARPVQAARSFDHQRAPSMTSSMDSAASPLYSPPPTARPVQAARGFDHQRAPSMTSSMDSAASPLYSPPPTAPFFTNAQGPVQA